MFQAFIFKETLILYLYNCVQKTHIYMKYN